MEMETNSLLLCPIAFRSKQINRLCSCSCSCSYCSCLLVVFRSNDYCAHPVVDRGRDSVTFLSFPFLSISIYLSLYLHLSLFLLSQSIRIEKVILYLSLMLSNRTELNRTEPNRTEPNRTEPNRTEPNRTEPNRTEEQSTIRSSLLNRDKYLRRLFCAFLPNKLGGISIN
jgi:hypothetical protein